jgi:hypothetical protein
MTALNSPRTIALLQLEGFDVVTVEALGREAADDINDIKPS